MRKRAIALGVAAAAGAAVAVKMVTRAKTISWEDVSSLIPHAGNSGFVQVDGARIHFQEFGDATKPTLLLIHGYTASLYVWKTVAPMLADEGFHVIAVDLLGFGYSDKPSWFDYAISSQARMIARFMNRIGIGRATILGSSYGGAVAATIALDYPERVEKLVLVDTVCNNNLKNHPILKLAAIRGVGEALAPFLIDSRAYQRHRMRGTLSPANHDLITDDRVESILRPLTNAEGHRALLATSRAWSAERIEQDAHLINQPTLIIWGEDDKVIPVDDGYRLHYSMLHSRLVILKDCGHVPQEEKSDLFVELVAGFCDDRKGWISEVGAAASLV
ncbi:MAG TPA: alpha/beta hydrolase [Pyrinomonadaceae bacterium]|nr:alpha/beta hydrolase [Pyrinomonadaceae bacterium]